MANSIDAYRDQLLALLPQGQAWPKHTDSELAKLLQGIAHELHRTEKRAEDILDEAHPSKAFEMFEEWETMHGLPHACGGSQNFQERRSALIQAYQSRGGQSREFLLLWQPSLASQSLLLNTVNACMATASAKFSAMKTATTPGK
ncbi:putative phage tail protein [Aliamphritea spongicola]|nr:putative phage tail protein [Aliamphritea spongicola]